MAKAKTTKTVSTRKHIDYEELVKELLSQISVEAQISVSETEDLIQVQLETPEPAVLIGYHGETLSSLERVLGLIVEKRTGEWKKLTINVGDYRERREETLKNLALTTAQRVKFSGNPWPLPPLSASERRIVHLILGDHPDVYSESEGEGKTRRIVVKPRSK